MLLFVFSIAAIPANAKQNKNSNIDNSNNNVNQNSNGNSNINTNTNSQNGERVTDIDQSLDQKKQDLSEIEAKIETYSKLVDVKQQEQKTLANQMDMIDNQINTTNEEIKKADKDMEIINLEIQELELKINEQNNQLKQKQATLEVLLNDLYRKDNKNILELLLSYSGLSSFIQEIAYTEQANQRVFNKLQEINDIRKDLEAKKQQGEEDQQNLEDSRQKKMEKTYYLEGEQNSKEKLLTDTKGEEGRYQELLKRVEEEKQTLLGDIDELSASIPGGLDSTISHQPKPTSGLASNDWYYSQRDPRWAGSDIGYSNTKMSKYGCAVTCVAMILQYHGISMNPGILARQPIFSNDLIVWPDQWQYLKRIGGYSHGNIDWDVVDKELTDRNPVIVFVRANGRGAGHYVVIHHKDHNGKYVVHDPYFGANIFLDSTRENIGVLYHSSTSIDQMIIYHNTKRSGEPPPPEDTNKNVNSNNNKNSNKNTNSNKH